MFEESYDTDMNFDRIVALSWGADPAEVITVKIRDKELYDD